MRVGLVAPVLIWAATASVSFAQGLQAQCGTETGRAYAVAQGVVTAEDAGWYDDRMRGETVMRIDTDTGAVDLRFRDATGIWRTPADDGGQAEFFGAHDGPPGAFMVLVRYPGTTVETLTVASHGANTATLIHTVARAMPQMTNSRVMVAECVVSSY